MNIMHYLEMMLRDIPINFPERFGQYISSSLKKKKNLRIFTTQTLSYPEAPTSLTSLMTTRRDS